MFRSLARSHAPRLLRRQAAMEGGRPMSAAADSQPTETVTVEERSLSGYNASVRHVS